MITNLLFDFSKVILFPKDESYQGLLNDLYRKITKEGGLFLDHYRFNEELLNFLKPLKKKFILSIYTTDIVQNDLAARAILRPIFENIFVANDLGISKKDPNGYLEITKRLGANPSEILYIDDGEANIKAASNAGLKTIQYFSNEQLIKELTSKLQI